ncbi:MAG: hypothetical protein CVU91_10135 [Firmicutes bacterium HGW-Firmicutes-16]|nr:MAG: hypothetical protein CVU91_10135 [Firmicutes bacterium HGW-Firmicutes-16]
MKISKHDQKLILVLLGIAVFLAAYFGICKSFNDRKADAEAQITQLEAEVEMLSAYSSSQAAYQDEINKIGDSIANELAAYPSDVRSEDLIMYVTELETEIGLSVNGISVASPEVVAKFTVPNKGVGSYQLVPVVAIKTALTIECNLNYTQLKSLIDYVNLNSYKAGISDVSVSYDSQTGGLSGSVTIDKYFISSADYTYTPTVTPSIVKGTNDPFGTFTKPVTTSPSPSPTGTN